MVFKVINIKDGIYYLKGAEMRLYADSPYNDLTICNEPKEEIFNNDYRMSKSTEKNDYFSELIIITSLIYISEDINVWDDLSVMDDDYSLLFNAKDYRDFKNSIVFKRGISKRVQNP